MAVELTDEQFAAVYRALKMANEPYTEDQVDELVHLEWLAWDSIRSRADRVATAPSSEEHPTSSE